MRNGFNISGASELIHELRTVPEEALLRLATSCSMLTPGRSLLDIQTMRGGTIRVARDFSFACDSKSSRRPVHPSALEYAIAGLGGCVLATYMQGASARGITVRDLQIVLDAVADEPSGIAAPMRELAYTIRIDCDADVEQVLGLARHVSCLSPNHRAFVDTNSIQLNVYRTASGGKVLEHRLGVSRLDESRLGSEARSHARLHAEATWTYGTLATVQCATDETSSPAFGIDQPKQYLGLDKAPNPQEYLLSAIAAELTQRLSAAAMRDSVDVDAVDVRCAGSIDLQGLTYINPEAPVKLHDIAVDVYLASATPLSQLEPLVRECCTQSVLQATICQAGSIQVTVEHNGQHVGQFRSDRAQVDEYLPVIARLAEQVAAAWQAGLDQARASA